MGSRANTSDAGAEGRTSGAQFYGRSFGDKLVICMSCRPQSRMQGCLTIPLQMRIIIKLQVCQHFHQWWGQCIIKVHHPNGAITKCPIAPPANASSASDISAYTKIHHYSSSRTVPSRSMFAFGCLDFLWVILETVIAQPNRACARDIFYQVVQWRWRLLVAKEKLLLACIGDDNACCEFTHPAAVFHSNDFQSKGCRGRRAWSRDTSSSSGACGRAAGVYILFKSKVLLIQRRIVTSVNLLSAYLLMDTLM